MSCRSNAAPFDLPPDSACRGARSLPDFHFITMLDAYRSSGGLVRAEEALAMFPSEHASDIARLARWIVQRQVISFYWNAETWLPLFQFRRSDMSIRVELDAVFAELNNIYDRWELATWFAWPNSVLADRSPAEAFMADPVAVLHAARLDRFVVNG